MPETIEYRSLPQYDGYRVGNDGSFWSRHRPIKGALGDWRQLGGAKGPEGYIVVRLKRTADGEYECRLLHQLILEAFIGPRPPGHEACHNDGIKTNNAVTNLRWDSRSANMQDRIRHGLKIRRSSVRTRNEIRECYANGETVEQLQKRFGLSFRRVLAICRGEIDHRRLECARSRVVATEFGRRLDEAIRARCTTRTAFAKAAGISRNRIDDWVYGGMMPNSKFLMAIAVHLGVSVDYLLGLTDEPHAVVPFDAMREPADNAILREIDAFVKTIGPAEALRRMALNSPSRRRSQPSGA